MTPDANDLCVFAVKRGDIENRIDASYNHPKYKSVISNLKMHLNIVDFSDSISGGATPLRANEEQYTNSGIKFLRIQNITPMGFDFSDVKYITEAVHNNLLRRSQLSVNDLLMTITGRIGTSAVVTESCLPANINQHIVRIRLKQGINPHFVAAYLNSPIGLLLSNRSVTGTTRLALDYESIKKIPVPDICPKKQEYLHAISRNAVLNYQQMQQKVYECLNGLQSSISSKYGFSCTNNIRLCFAICLSDLDGVIDAKRYASMATHASEFKISDICDIVDEKVNVSRFDKQIIDWIRIDDLPNQPLDIEQVRTQPANEVEGTFFEVQEGDILVARLGPTILNQKIVMVRSVERTTIASAEFLVLRCKKGYNPEAVMAVLKTAYYRELMYSHARGSTPSRYRLNREDMLKLPFPDIREHQDKIADDANNVREQVKAMRIQAEQEWQAAKEQFERELLEG